MLFLYADVLARYHRQQGRQVIYSTGTDEHGDKVAEKAASLDLSPQDLADRICLDFQTLLQALNISYDRFIRTTDQAHTQRVQLAWQQLADYIYKGSFKGWYCLGCEDYKTETVVKDSQGVCPDHQRPYQQLEQENYFFKLSAFTDQIREQIETNQLKIVPKTRRREVLAQLAEPPTDLSISRPSAKTKWGIAVPGDDSQVIYVWFDALLNYITVLGYPEHQDFVDYWPADIQVIGKDISRFHAIIWPAVLLALKLPLYKMLYVHGFVTSDGAKMSKSLGNVVDPLELIQTYGLDAFRYFFLRHIPSYGDGDFSLAKFQSAYQAELANELGNTVMRVAQMVISYQTGVVGKLPTGIHDTNLYHKAIKQCQFDRALDFVWQQIQELNRYLEVEQPWQLAKTDKEHLREVLAYATAVLLEVAELLVPFLPTTAEIIKTTFTSGYIKQKPSQLFPRLEPKAA